MGTFLAAAISLRPIVEPSLSDMAALFKVGWDDVYLAQAHSEGEMILYGFRNDTAKEK